MPPDNPKGRKPRQSPGSYRFLKGERVIPESDRTPSSKPPVSSDRNELVISSRTSVRRVGTDRAPDSRRPIRRSSRPPASAPEPDPREAALQKRGEHYDEQGLVLQNMIEIVEQIGGQDQLVRILQLRAETKLTIARGEVLSDKLREKAISIWRVLNDTIHFDRVGNPRLTLPALSELIRALEPKTRIDPDFSQSGSPRSLSPKEMERSLRHSEHRALRGTSKIEGLDPKRDKHVYHAMTMGVNTATGRNGTEKTLELVREEVGQMSDDKLAMVLLYHEMIHGATIRTHDAADRSRTEIKDILNDAKAKGLGPRQMQASLGRANVKKGMNEAAEHGNDLAERIVLILKMMGQETTMSESLGLFTTPAGLIKLKKDIESMSDSGKKRSTLKVINEAMAVKSHRKRETPLPAELEEQLK